MKSFLFLFIFYYCAGAAAQITPLPHGTVFGTRPDTTVMAPADSIAHIMGNKKRISTTIRGVVKKITQQKGGWFELEAGHGEVISAHFKNYDVTLPLALKGRTVIIEGVALKQFKADDMQHFAGEPVVAPKPAKKKRATKLKTAFEISGLMVDK